MTKKKLFEDIKRHPARIYRTPNDVLRDRRFGDAERLEILRAWRQANDQAGDQVRDQVRDQADDTAQNDIDAMIAELEHRLCASGHAAE
jgi:hypothetical protein